MLTPRLHERRGRKCRVASGEVDHLPLLLHAVAPRATRCYPTESRDIGNQHARPPACSVRSSSAVIVRADDVSIACQSVKSIPRQVPRTFERPGPTVPPHEIALAPRIHPSQMARGPSRSNSPPATPHPSVECTASCARSQSSNGLLRPGLPSVLPISGTPPQVLPELHVRHTAATSGHEEHTA